MVLHIRPTKQQDLDQWHLLYTADWLLSAVSPSGSTIGFIDKDSLEVQWVSPAGDQDALTKAIEDYRQRQKANAESAESDRTSGEDRRA